MNISLDTINYYLPSQTLKNEDLAKKFNKSIEEIFKISGVNKRHIRSHNQIGSDLGYHAAKKILTKKSYLKEIDFLIFCTEGLDYKAPTTSSVLHHRLGLKESCGCIDIPMGCTGFVYGLSMAKSLLFSRTATCILLINADIPSSVIHSDDFDLRVLFGDAGSAVVLKESQNKSNSASIGQFVFGSDGSGAKNLMVEHGSTRNQINKKWLDDYKSESGNLEHGRMFMNGLEILRFSLSKVPTLLNEVLKKNDLNFEEIDLFIFHQASQLILKMLKRKCNIPDDKFYTYFEEIGNTVSCSIPIAMFHAQKENRLKRGDRVMILGFGVGYSWAGTVITY